MKVHQLEMSDQAPTLKFMFNIQFIFDVELLEAYLQLLNH